MRGGLLEEHPLKPILTEKRNILFQLRAAREALEARDPAFNSPAPGFAALKQLAAQGHAPIVYLYPLDEGAIWQIIHRDQGEAPAEADQGLVHRLTLPRVQGLLFHDSAREGGKANQPPGWLWAYLGWLGALHDRKVTPAARAEATRLWEASMAFVLAFLGEELMAPIAARLKDLGAGRAVLIPGGLLGFLPLHAAPIDGIPVGDRFEVRYAPSATLLNRAYEVLPKAKPVRPYLVAVANPDRSLPFTDGQVRKIGELFAPDVKAIVYGTGARRDWLLRNASSADYLELSTHASFDLVNPANSAFQLAYPDGRYQESLEPITSGRGDYEKLSLNDIWSETLALKPGCLVSANACETGLFDLKPKALEEQFGFPAAFLSAGASTVIASFWAVNDFSTWLLTEALYRRMIKGGENPARALQQASKELRALTCEEVIKRVDRELPGVEAVRKAAEAENDTEAYHAATATLSAMRSQRAQLARQDPASCPFDHPYYWAAFGVHGAARLTETENQSRAAITETGLTRKRTKQPWWKVWH